MTGKQANRPSKRRAITTLFAEPPAMDRGADGRANQHKLFEEAATDFDPNTGRETPNPNRMRRRRREAWVSTYHKQGRLTHAQAAAADTLRMAAEGMPDRDPLAALLTTRSRGGSDPEAARVDARRLFHRLWARVPASSRPVIERVVLHDLPIWHGNVAQRDRHMQRLAVGLDAIC